MSEKATLLTSIPPVKHTSSSSSGSTSGASSTSSGLLKPTGSTTTATQSGFTNTAQQASSKVDTESKASSSVVSNETSNVPMDAVELESAPESISMFQGVIYVSFVLTFCLAGFAAVVLFRKGLKCAEQRFVSASKLLGAVFGWAALSGFFGTYLFANYLNGKSDAAPLTWLIFFWVLAAPLVGIVLNHLLTPGNKPEKARLIVDAIVYVAIFGASMIAVVDGLKENAVLLFSLLGCFLFIIPVARFFSLFKTAKARHPELRETMDQVLIYTLLVIPGLFPVLAFARVCGLSPEAFIFLSNFLTFDFILVAACSMIASLPDGSDAVAAEPEAARVEEAPKPAPVAEKPAPAPMPTAPSGGLKPKKLNPVKAPVKPTSADSNGSIPAAPQKPKRTESADATAPNAPSRIKAPAKPKKRF